MNHRLTLWAATLALTLSLTPVQAADPATPAGPSGSVPHGVVRATLPNGLRVVVVPDALAPVVTTQLSYSAGSIDAPPGFPGMAHALEHMMFRGSEGLDRDQLYELGALLGGVYNASTTETRTTYTYTIPATDLGLVMHIEALRMTGASITQADWEQERGAIEQEVSRDLSSPIYNYFAQVQSILFAGTPYDHDALGTRPSFDQTDATMLRTFYERWYAPNNAVLVIAGDIVPEEALAQAQAAFGSIPTRTIPPHPVITPGPVDPQTLTLPTNFPVGLVTLAYRMPGLTSPDFATADVLGDILASQRGSLYALVPAGRALSARFSYQPKTDVGMGLLFAAFPNNGDPAPVLADIKQVLADILRDGVPPALVESMKQQELAQLAFQNDSITGLARTWIRAVAEQNLDSPDDIARAYEAVTPEAVNRLARTLLNPEQAVTAILTPQGPGSPGASAGFGGAESFDRVPDHPVTLPDWAAAALLRVQVPDPGQPPTVTTLPNGLRLIVQPEHVSRTVSVFGSVRQVTETQEPKGQEGVAALTARMFGYGTETRDRLAFRKAVDDLAADVAAGPGFALKVLTPQFEPGMRLLAENELHPAFLNAGFPEPLFTISRRQLAQSLAGTLVSPDYRAGRAIDTALLPSDDLALREPIPATVTALTLDDLRAYYAATYRPDLTTIVVVGDTTPEDALRIVQSTFGGWQAQGPTPEIDLPPVALNTPANTRVPDPSALQDSVSLAGTLEVPVTSPDRYPLLLGNTILGGGFSSRLYQDLRVRTGYVYSVSSSVDWSRTRARYNVSYGADPENVDKARALVIRDLTDMQTTPLSNTELTRAKAQILRRLPMQRASVGAVASQYLRLAELGLPLDALRTAGAKYDAITAEQIQAAFARWIRPADLVQVVKGP